MKRHFSHSRIAPPIGASSESKTQGNKVYYPMVGDEVLRVLDSMQLTAKREVATPVNWSQATM